MYIPIERYLTIGNVLEVAPGILFIWGGLVTKEASKTLLDKCNCPHLPACPRLEDMPRWNDWSLNWGPQIERANICRRLGCKHHAYCYQVAHIEPYLVPPLHADCLRHKDQSPDDWTYDTEAQEFVHTSSSARVKAPMRRNPKFEKVAYYPKHTVTGIKQNFRSEPEDVKPESSTPSSPPPARRGRPRKYPVSN